MIYIYIYGIRNPCVLQAPVVSTFCETRRLTSKAFWKSPGILNLRILNVCVRIDIHIHIDMK